jgi:hypothetical protein
MNYLQRLHSDIETEAVDDQFIDSISSDNSHIEVYVTQGEKQNFEVKIQLDVPKDFVKSKDKQYREFDILKDTSEVPPFVKMLAKYSSESYDGMSCTDYLGRLHTPALIIDINGVLESFKQNYVLDIVDQLEDEFNQDTCEIMYAFNTNKPSKLGVNIREYIEQNTGIPCTYTVRYKNDNPIKVFNLNS